MTDKTKPPVFELFEEAMKNYDQALQSGIKLQEDTARWWTECMTKAVAPQEWQKRVQALASDTIPIMQKRMEESLRVVEQSARTSLDLLKQALDTVQSDSAASAQSKLQDLWEASLQAFRNNAQALTQANARVIESWSQLFTQASEAATPKSRSK